MTTLTAILLACLAAPCVLSCGYLFLLTLLSAAPRTVQPASRTLRFDFIVPAHNEMAIIERTISSLRAVDWPADRFRVITVADNCSDETAGVARAAGALVWERKDPENRGKGYALRHAFELSRADQWADAVVVVDADSEVSANMLQAIAVHLERGVQAVQVHYGVRNPMDSWRTRLITIAKGSFHIVRSRARERLGLSTGIRGNGWCVTHRLLEQVPFQAFSLTEDVEYGIALGLAGHRVAYADDAHADADMVVREDIARKQRQRWEDGRFALIRTQVGTLLARALQQRSALCLDLACDLLVLPLSYVAFNVLALCVLAAIADHYQWAGMGFLWTGLACAAALTCYVLRGWQLSGVGIRGALDLAAVPWFLIWKLWLLLRFRRSSEWVRTGREGG